LDSYLQGEEIFEAAIREVKEETGVSIREQNGIPTCCTM